MGKASSHYLLFALPCSILGINFWSLPSVCTYCPSENCIFTSCISPSKEMCYHVSNHKDKQRIKKVFGVPFEQEDDFVPAYHINGFDQPLLPVLSNEDSTAVRLYRWRLLPSTVPDEASFTANTLNARGEEIFDKITYKDYWQNRCLVICTGFFEPHKALGGRHVHSYYIKPKREEFFTLGAIWSKWKGMGTCTIITVAASPLMEEVHNEGKRMPLMLSADAAQQWLRSELSQEAMKALMKQSSSDTELEAYRVMDGVFNARKDTNLPQVITPFDGAAGQMSLF